MGRMKHLSTLLVALLLLQMLPIFGGKAHAADPEAVFPDSALNQAVHSWLGVPVSQTVYQSDIITRLGQTGGSFSAFGKGITDLSGMEVFEGTGVTSMSLHNNNITDLTPISNITSLTNLSLGDNPNLENIGPISNLTNLQMLYLFGISSQADITPLTALTNLKSLELFSVAVPLSGVPFDISPLANMPWLEYLDIHNNNLTDAEFASVGSITNLKRLHAYSNEITTLAPLAGLNNLDEVNVYNNRITDISALAGKNITRLSLQYNRITDVSPLLGMPINPTWSSMSYNFVDIWSPGDNQTVAGYFSAAQRQPQQKFTTADDSWNPSNSISISVGSTGNINQGSFNTTDGTTFVNPGYPSSTGVYYNEAYYWRESTIVSEDPSIVAVEANCCGNPGYHLKGVSAGTAYVNYYLFGVDSTFTKQRVQVTVTGPTLTSIAVTPFPGFVNVGDTLQYTATGTFSDGSTQNVTANSTWTTDNGAIATVNDTSSKGLVTGVTPGTTWVRATWNGITGTASAIVSAAPPTVTSFTITPATATINIGDTQQYTATATFSDGSSSDVTGMSNWSIDESWIASQFDGLATGVSAGTTTIRAEWNGQTASATVNVLGPALQSITVSPATATINVNQYQGYTATAHFADNSTQDVTTLATWTIADPSIATQQGGQPYLFRGAAAGTTGISATWNGMTGNASLTVNAPVTLQSITVTPATATVQVGDTQQYTATANFSDGSTQDVTSLASWGGGNFGIATVANQPGFKGIATGVSPGTTFVRADWNGLNGTANITVTAAPVPPVTLQSITVAPATATVQVGDTQQYTATANFSDGSTQDVTNIAVWALGDPAKATINASGLATGTAAGTTGVTATWNGMTGNASLTVTTVPVPPATLQSITVTPATASIQVGNTQQYNATANFSDGSTQDVTNVAVWALGDPTKATINASGLATGTAAGTTGVTATWNGMTGNASLTVTAVPVTPPTGGGSSDPTLQSITVTPATATVQVGDTQQYTATANYSDGSKKDVTNSAAWALGDPTKAAINGTGLATGSAVGTTGVMATWGGMTGNASLTVTALPVKITKLEVTPKEATIFTGEIQEYVAIAYYSDSTKKDVTKDASWTISDSTIASVAKGKAKGLSAGKTGVKAEFEGLNDTAKLTVQDKPVEIKVYQDLTPQLAAPDQVNAGDNFNLKVTLANIGDEDVTDEFTANIYVRKVADKKSGTVTIASIDAEGWTLLESYVVKTGLKAGATMKFEVPLQLLEKGTYEIKVIADEDNITADVDRSNNQDQKVTIAVKEEDPVPIPEDKPRIPKTGDGSVLDPKEANNVPYMLLAVLLAVIALARKLTRNKEQ